MGPQFARSTKGMALIAIFQIFSLDKGDANQIAATLYRSGDPASDAISEYARLYHASRYMSIIIEEFFGAAAPSGAPADGGTGEDTAARRKPGLCPNPADAVPGRRCAGTTAGTRGHGARDGACLNERRA